MSAEENYIDINRKSWNNKVDAHVASAFYNMEGFIKGKSSLNVIELDLLGDVKGKSILHLQCHFGQDSLSLARMGAKITGVDLSDKAIEKAKELAEQLELDANFICCDIYELPSILNQTFDIVFTSYGTIGWLPDLDKWGRLISKYLKPSGKFVFVEFHPVVWMFDDAFDKVGYNYFNDGPIIEAAEGTYADRSAEISPTTVSWNHSMSEVVTSLIRNGLKIDSFNEFDYSPYNCFQHTVEFEPHKFRIAHLGNRIPMVYALAASN